MPDHELQHSTGLALPGSTTATSLQLPPTLSYQEWEEAGSILSRAHDTVNWWIGDWVNYGEARYGRKYAKALDLTGLARGTLENYAYVCKRVEPARRRPGLSWSHHMAVAPLRSQAQEKLLGQAAEQGWDVRSLRRAFVVPSGEREHSRIQWRLLALGSDMKNEVWVAADDRSKSWAGKKFVDTPRMLEDLPQQFANADANRIVERIDVLWLRNRAIRAAFEIEHTTPVYSGLLRMSDLLTVVPNLDIRLYIVAPERRRQLVLDQVNRPTFADRGLPKKCRLITFERLTDEMEQLGDRTAHLTDSFLLSISESCELIEGDATIVDD